MKRPITVLALVGLMYSAVGAVSAGPGFNNKFQPGDPTVVECRDSEDNVVGTITYDGPEYMWPPNHKYQGVTVVATAVDPDDDVTLSTEGTHDEYAEDGTEMNGAGSTDDDIDPATASDMQQSEVVNAHAIRSERSGAGDGRTYSIDWQATFTDDDGDEGYGTAVCGSADLDESGFEPNADAFTSNVPHDMSCIHWKNGASSKAKCTA